MGIMIIFHACLKYFTLILIICILMLVEFQICQQILPEDWIQTLCNVILQTLIICWYRHKIPKNMLTVYCLESLYFSLTKCTSVNHELSNITVFAPKFLWAKSFRLRFLCIARLWYSIELYNKKQWLLENCGQL